MISADSSIPSSMVGGQAFPFTPWSLIYQSQDPADPLAMAALDRLARAYWQPLYACLRAMGYGHAAAEDEVQRLFESLFSRESLRGVLPGQVRFRSFLLTCLKNSLVSSHRREMTLKRGEGAEPEPLDGAAALQVAEQALASSAELAMDRAWAREVFERAFSLLEADALKRGRAEVFAVLKPVLRGESPMGGYAGLCSALEVPEGTARKMVFDLRARFGVFIRNEVAATVADSAEVDNEVRYLVSLI